MIYQKIFTSENPYRLGIGVFPTFPEHRHADLEFNFCLEGEFEIVIDKKLHRVFEGGMTFVHSMESHEIIGSQNGDRRVMTLIVGHSLMKKYFSEFNRAAFVESVYDLNLDGRGEIKELFFECERLLRSNSPGKDMMLTGNIYRLLASMLDLLAVSKEGSEIESNYSKVENIEKALELIYYKYKDPITVEDAAVLTGYSKSNFCKIFKRTVGEGFHQALNRQRAENAAGLLKLSNMSVSDIAAEVGFSEAKAFCRVFKAIYGITPGQYRKNETKKRG